VVLEGTDPIHVDPPFVQVPREGLTRFCSLVQRFSVREQLEWTSGTSWTSLLGRGGFEVRWSKVVSNPWSAEDWVLGRLIIGERIRCADGIHDTGGPPT